MEDVKRAGISNCNHISLNLLIFKQIKKNIIRETNKLSFCKGSHRRRVLLYFLLKSVKQKSIQNSSNALKNFTNSHSCKIVCVIPSPSINSYRGLSGPPYRNKLSDQLSFSFFSARSNQIISLSQNVNELYIKSVKRAVLNTEFSEDAHHKLINKFGAVLSKSANANY